MLIFMAALSLLATSALIVTNKVVLEQLPSVRASGFLTLLHVTTTYILVRSTTACSGVKRAAIDWRWLLTLTIVGTGSILFSNLTLQYASVTFHQLARILMMPMSSAVGYTVYGKVVTAIDWMGFAVLSGGVYLCLQGEATSTAFGAFLAVTANATSVAGAFLVKYLCQRFSVSSKDFMEMMGPWQIGVSCAGLVLSGGAPEMLQVISSFKITLVLPLSLNLAMAVAVNFLSTYLQKTATPVFYSVLAQAKTSSTILLGVVAYGNSLSPMAAFGVVACLCTSFLIAVREVKSNEAAKEDGA